MSKRAPVVEAVIIPVLLAFGVIALVGFLCWVNGSSTDVGENAENACNADSGGEIVNESEPRDGKI
jgi:hypothetical protein